MRCFDYYFVTIVGANSAWAGGAEQARIFECELIDGGCAGIFRRRVSYCRETAARIAFRNDLPLDCGTPSHRQGIDNDCSASCSNVLTYIKQQVE